MAVAFLTTLGLSAQNFMVVGTYDGDQEETMDKLTQNLGVGYVLNENWTLGMIQGRNDGQHDCWCRLFLQCVERS